MPPPQHTADRARESGVEFGDATGLDEVVDERMGCHRAFSASGRRSAACSMAPRQVDPVKQGLAGAMARQHVLDIGGAFDDVDLEPGVAPGAAQAPGCAAPGRAWTWGHQPTRSWHLNVRLPSSNAGHNDHRGRRAMRSRIR
jgi:hypothetical protein